MPSSFEPPGAVLPRVKAAELLGVSKRRLDTMLRHGILPTLALGDVPAAREDRWITAGEAAAILGVNRQRVTQLVEAGRLPCVQPAPMARRWFRRGQVEVIANAREARRLARSS